MTTTTSPPDEDALLGGLRGRVLEIGAGSGECVPFLSPDVEWIGLEPDPEVLGELRRAAGRRFTHSTVIEGVAEDIPLPDDHVDAVLSSRVLCSVEDQAGVLAEIERVLRPGGVFVFVEHVAAPRGTILRFVQRMARGPGRRRPGACDPARDTLDAIRTRFPDVDATEYRGPGLPIVGVPHIAGTARASAPVGG